MARRKRAYFIDEQRFTPSQFQRLSRARKIEAMVDWFGRHYEDPAHRVLYETREGGYQWAGAGPHDANDVLQEEFGDIADYSAIERAVDRVQSEGTYDWASTDWFRSDFDDDDDDGFDEDGNRSINLPLPDLAFDLPGNEEPNLRAEVISRLDRFEAILVQATEDRARRAHNRPPEMIDDDDLLPWEALEDARAASAELREETGKEEPDDRRVIAAATKLKVFAGGVGAWLALKAGEGIVSGAAWDGVKAAYQNPTAIYEAAMNLAQAATEWGQNLMSFW